MSGTTGGPWSGLRRTGSPEVGRGDPQGILVGSSGGTADYAAGTSTIVATPRAAARTASSGASTITISRLRRPIRRPARRATDGFEALTDLTFADQAGDGIWVQLDPATIMYTSPSDPAEFTGASVVATWWVGSWSASTVLRVGPVEDLPAGHRPGSDGPGRPSRSRRPGGPGGSV